MPSSRIPLLLSVAALLALAGAPLVAGAASGEPAALSRLRLLPTLSDDTTALSDPALANAPLSPARMAVELSLAYPTHLAATAGALLLATRVVTDASGPGLDGRLAAIEGGDLPGQAAFAISLVLVAPLCSAAVVWAIADGTPGFDAQLLLTYAGGATAQALALGLVALFPGVGAILLGPLLVAVTEVAVANLTRVRSPGAVLPPPPAPATGASPGPPSPAAARVASSATLLHASF